MIKIILPALFPSWRFFSGIGPSPRIYYALLHIESDEPTQWLEFRPKPKVLSVKEQVLRLFHNPQWNETLYINTCAERLFEGYAEMRAREIMHRLLAAVARKEILVGEKDNYLVYRIGAVMREEEHVYEQITFTSSPALLKGFC
ncbi:hypothetical protein GCM10011613_13500 [Cellvibrio zantedeschiae]|uniref:Uncharacterized protein n=1 Tax=Cellvibrio zantedeschiae TaxID=1237077 RepID=A0ABQ3AWY2_9GAMM|nr:hypothetical protein [Cellvibrio zantedeschiae]GGY70368.1 hypothetical protein GCM10011613_13500 [Cellvibrio zantedeschiae]